MPTPACSRKAFTLVEMLVVISIIGMLVGLLLPAVQSARESGRRIQCANNVKQLVLAISAFHEANGKLPANTEFSGYAETAVDSSWMTQILPYIDQEPLFSQVDFSQAVGQQPNLTVGQTVIVSFRCPSDNSFADGRDHGVYTAGCCDDNRWWISVNGAITNYRACAGANWGWGDFVVSQDSGPFSGTADAYDGLDHGNGIICRDWAQLDPNRFENVKDGLSNTFAVGESVAGWCAWNNWRWSNGCTATCAIPLNYRKGTMDLTTVWWDWSNTYSFFSQHPGGGNFGMCDGSVHYVNDSIDINVYRGLATIACGEAVELGN